MGSRIRENVRYLFECFCEVAPGGAGSEPSVLRKYPDSYNNEEEQKYLPRFTFPCAFENVHVQHYSFVLTSSDSKYTFCFCRYDPRTKTSLVILSHLPWHDIFYKLLNCIAILLSSGEKTELLSFLDACRIRPPMPGHTLKVTYNAGHNIFTCECPDMQLPSIPGNCNLTEYFSALDAKCMAGLWAALLHERRVAVVASKPSRLSATVQAANATLYPMSWQHIFIPILPSHLVDYLSAPMPFLIGVPRSVMEIVKLSDIGDVVILDADTNVLKTSFNDLETLPSEVVSSLKKALSDKHALGDAVSRAFLRALVSLIGGYRDAIRLEQGKLITFNPEAFIRTRKNMQPFLKKILQSQIFQQFIEERLELLNSGRGFNDEFEQECYNYAEQWSGGSGQRLKQQYRDWAKAMKREGGAFFKTVKDKANPAVKSAVKSVRQGGRNMKSAVKGFKMTIPKHGSRPSSVNTTDDGRFSYGSATPAASGSSESLGSVSSSRSAPQSPPVLPLDLLDEMEMMFPSADGSQRSSTLSPRDLHNMSQLNASEKSKTLSLRPPPRLLERPSVPARYPIVPTRNLLDLTEAPLPPPRTGNLARGKPHFVSHITKNDGNGLSVFHTGAIHFTEVPNDHTKLKACSSVGRRKASLGSPARLPHRNGEALKVTLSAPVPAPVSAAATATAATGPINKQLAARTASYVHSNTTTNCNTQLKEASDSESDLIQLDVSQGNTSPKLEDFDPLKCKSKTDTNPYQTKRSADSDLLQEYGLDFSRFGFTDDFSPGSSASENFAQPKMSVPKGWTTFQ